MRRGVGAFGLVLVSFAAVLQCGDDDDNNVTPDGGAEAAADTFIADNATQDVSTDSPPPVTNVDVTTHITGDTTWTSDHTYTLKADIFVQSGTLTIQPGVRILGDSGSSLIVTTNGKINAVGTAAKPIVFTSSKAIGTRGPGNWDGIGLGGKAPLNAVTDAAFPTIDFEGFDGGAPSFGGTDPAHDCGKLEYVRIEFAHKGLVVGGCGNTTKIDFVQIHRGSDDGVQMLGGSANLKHVVISQFGDDGVDWEAGWVGKVQFLILQQSVGNNAFEADNGQAPPPAPQSAPLMYNITLVGSGAAPGTVSPPFGQFGMFLRRGTAGIFKNTIVQKFADIPIDIVGSASVAHAEAGALSVDNAIIWDNAKMGATFPVEGTDNDNGFNEAAFFFEAQRQNRAVDPALGDALNLLTPNFKPQTGSPALTGAVTPPSDGFFDTTATFVGAIGAVDWTSGWVAFPQN